MSDQADQDLEREAEALFERLASGDREVTDRVARLHLVVPQPLLGDSPEALDDYLDGLFDDLGSAEDLLERLEDLRPSEAAGGPGVRYEAVVPSEALESLPETLEAMMAQLSLAFEGVDRALAALGSESDDAPDGLPAVLAEHPQIGFEEQLRKARLALKRLRRYRLHDRSRGEIVGQMRDRQRTEELREIAGFLWALQEAARSFEALGMPKQHIRDYLSFLYHMPDWAEMESYVERFRQAVEGLDEPDGEG